MMAFNRGLKMVIMAVLPVLVLVNLYVFAVQNYGDVANFFSVDLQFFENDTFFGFSSLILMFEDFPVDAIKSFFRYFTNLGDTVLFRIPSIITSIHNLSTGGKILDVVKNIAMGIFQPITIFLQLVYLFVQLVNIIIGIVIMILHAFAGWYNVPYYSPYPDEPITVITSVFL